MNYPPYYRFIGEAFISELIDQLTQGHHVALLGPRQGGKALVLEELMRRSQIIQGADRPKVVRLIGNEFRKFGEVRFLHYLAKRLEVEKTVSTNTNRPLSGKLEDLFKMAVNMYGQPPVWIFVQDILSFPTQIARDLLYAFQFCHDDPQLRSRIAVVVTGSADFVHLTYEQLSPYRHAQKFLVCGLDEKYAAAFFYHRRTRQRGEEKHDEGMAPININTAQEITPDAFQYLYTQTGGNPHLIQEIIITAARHSHMRPPPELTGRWNLKQTKACIKNFALTFMPNDYFCRIILREIERLPGAFDLLLEVLGKGDGNVQIPQRKSPHPLEVYGVVRRDKYRKAFIASPLWRCFISTVLTPRHIADVYADQHRWEEAWKQYQALPLEQRDRPLSSHATFRLRSILPSWEDSLVDQVAGGPDIVNKQFFQGTQYLLGFDVGGVYDFSTTPPTLLYSGSDAPRGSRIFLPSAEDKPVYQDEEGRKYWLDKERRRLFCDPQIALTGSPKIAPVLVLERKALARAVDTAEQVDLWHSLDRFWYAYQTAHDIEYKKDIGDLREKHLKVIERVNGLLTLQPFDMGKVVQGTADALVNTANYYRILICLVDGSGERIQAVASKCSVGAKDFNYRTDFPLQNAHLPLEQWDVQPWVCQIGHRCVIPNASSEDQTNPTTQWKKARRIGMKAITVVPIKISDEVLGTIHIERKDRAIPSPKELELFDILASQIAVAFHQAQRLTFLQRTLSVLTDKIQIVNPQAEVIFFNDAAADEYPGLEPGWQVKAIQSPHTEGVVKEVAEANAPIHHYIMPSNGASAAVDWLGAPIDDFRVQLEGPFKGADGRIGYLERAHDLTGPYQLITALESWLAQKEVRSTAKEILKFFHLQGFRWARIYLIKKSRSGGNFLESLEEFGINNRDKRSQFRQGNITYIYGAADPQPWHVLLEAMELSIYEYNPDQRPKQISKIQPLYGVSRYWTMDVQNRIELEKTDKRWVEAPLFVGQKAIGKVSLSMPDEPPPEKWELLKIAMVGAAVALNSAILAEAASMRAVEETWKMAAAQAVHQLANKLSPIESRLVYGLQDLPSEAQQSKSFIETSIEELKVAREILHDFKRYASEKPFEDDSTLEVLNLLESIKNEIQLKHPEVRSIQIARSVPSSFIRINRKAIAEVVEILVSDSIRHSGKQLAQLRIRIGAELSYGCKTLLSLERRFVGIQYRDNGLGIPKHLKDEIFEPFYTTHPQGTGLGLSIARRYIRRHGGEMVEEGEFGKGASFTIYLPVTERGRKK